jgi:hypothetical protein
MPADAVGAVGAAPPEADPAALVAADAEVAGAALVEGAALAALALAELAVVVAGFPPACARTVTEKRVGTARAKSVIPKRRMSIDPSRTWHEPKRLNDSRFDEASHPPTHEPVAAWAMVSPGWTMTRGV